MSHSQFTIPATHPCLAGHFPGRPVVPGVMILDHVIAAVSDSDLTAVTGVRRCKFTAPLYPDQPCSVVWTHSGRYLKFACHSANGLVARGTLVQAGD